MRCSIAQRAVLALFLFSSLSAVGQDLNKFINDWHEAAARADGKVFFGSMADSAVYIGTADHEYWTKPAFEKFARPYFDKGTAWDFKPYDRHIRYSADGQHAWFTELLETWMGVCRGSGVVRKTSSGWQIEQYHLSVTVPNEIIRDFIKLVEDYDRSQKN